MVEVFGVEPLMCGSGVVDTLCLRINFNVWMTPQISIIYEVCKTESGQCVISVIEVCSLGGKAERGIVRDGRKNKIDSST